MTITNNMPSTLHCNCLPGCQAQRHMDVVKFSSFETCICSPFAFCVVLDPGQILFTLVHETLGCDGPQEGHHIV